MTTCKYAQLSALGLLATLALGAPGCKKDPAPSAGTTPGASATSGSATSGSATSGSASAPAPGPAAPAAASELCFERATCEAACKGGSARSCRRWGELLTGGWSGPPADGHAAWTAGCALGDVGSCLSLVGEPANAEALARAVAAGTKGCEAGDAEACLYRAALVAHGEPEEVRSSGKTQREKRRWSVKACQAGHASACDAVALMDAMAPETEGDDVHQAPAGKALALCRGGALEVCESLVAADEAPGEAAYAVLADHCARGWAPACLAAGKGVEDADPDAAARHFAAGCRAGHAPSCAHADEADPFWNATFEVTRWDAAPGGEAGCGALTPSADRVTHLRLSVADEQLAVTRCPGKVCDDDVTWRLGERERARWAGAERMSSSDGERCEVEQTEISASREGDVLTLTVMERAAALESGKCSPSAVPDAKLRCRKQTVIVARRLDGRPE